MKKQELKEFKELVENNGHLITESLMDIASMDLNDVLVVGIMQTLITHQILLNMLERLYEK